MIIPLNSSIIRDMKYGSNSQGDCRWRTAANGKIVDESSEGLKRNKCNCIKWKPEGAVTKVNIIFNHHWKDGVAMTRPFLLPK